MADCNRCNDTKSVQCPKCDGTGQLPDNGSYKTCFHCNGKTEVRCPTCA